MTRRLPRVALFTISLTLTAATACSNGGTSSPAIDSTVQAQLRHDLVTLVNAAASRKTAAAQAALTALDSDAAAAHTAGRLSDAKLNQIRAAEAALHADLTSSSPAAPTLTTPSTSPAAPTLTTPSKTQSPTPKNGKGKGKGKGDKNGSGDGNRRGD